MVRLNLASSLAAAAALSGRLSAHAMPLDGEKVVDLEARDAPTAIPAGFNKVVFLENFAANSVLNLNKWQYDLGHNYPGGPPQWGTWEVQRYTSDAGNIFINSYGVLQIVPKKNANTGEWTSARIETKPGVDIQCFDGGKVRVQASIRLGAGRAAAGANDGFWPAFWLLSPAIRDNYQNWPAIGEIDILESVNALPTAWNIAHCGTNPGGPCNEPNGLGGSVSLQRGVFHTHTLDIDRTAADWKQESITWYIDGVKTRVLTPAQMQYNQDAWFALVNRKKFILLNVAVGGGFPDALAGKTTPTALSAGGVNNGMEVDYVVAWST
ncbi:concanavalin A-like lectin/glucanase domain-containing protein [Microdochium trichocladiopsis]|uniref:Concanavalin A-like lectin/glucanase domain-containing protein n=1 Tax=Microdochium trichocladiopsis TaxID=1682393 RepID=A0A9P9BM43_9PEZI|nr:concanavalin A-like lectin/glucanase domain-containing protein [Microdochium trichocladiopsis]KAH7025075.1 concanavalin A-like lectin/glucanase domain-containing protein [Microdochium trichocladiopsis]